jgi:hypothetical protein
MPDSCCAIGCSQLTAEYEAGVMFLPHPKRRKTVLLSIRLEFAISNIYCLITHYNYDYFKIKITLPLPSWGLSVLPDWAENQAQSGNNSGGISIQHSSFISECSKKLRCTGTQKCKM